MFSRHDVRNISLPSSSSRSRPEILDFFQIVLDVYRPPPPLTLLSTALWTRGRGERNPGKAANDELVRAGQAEHGKLVVIGRLGGRVEKKPGLLGHVKAGSAVGAVGSRGRWSRRGRNRRGGRSPAPGRQAPGGREPARRTQTNHERARGASAARHDGSGNASLLDPSLPVQLSETTVRQLEAGGRNPHGQAIGA